MKVSICWLSVHDFECLAPLFEQRVEVIGNSHGLDCLARRWQDLLSSVSPAGDGNSYCGTLRLVIPDLLAAVTAHGDQGCSLSLDDGDSVITAYWAVFLSQQPPVGVAVPDNSVMLSLRAATVSAVDGVKTFVI